MLCNRHSGSNGKSDRMILLVLVLGFWDFRAKPPAALECTMQNDPTGTREEDSSHKVMAVMAKSTGPDWGLSMLHLI